MRRRRGWPRRKTPQPGEEKVWAASSTVSRDSVKGQSNPGPFILFRMYCTYNNLRRRRRRPEKTRNHAVFPLKLPFFARVTAEVCVWRQKRKTKRFFDNPDGFTDCRGKRRHRFSRPFMGNVHCTVRKAAFRLTNVSIFIFT